MKSFLISLVFSLSVFASHSRPELLALYSGEDAYNAPYGLYCFGSEPEATKDGVFLGCQLEGGHAMMKWGPEVEVVAQSQYGLFSHPKEVGGRVSWYEFSEGADVTKVFDYKNKVLKTTLLNNLGPTMALIDAFIPIKNDSYVYRVQDESKKLSVWKNGNISTLYAENVSYIFQPTVSREGDFVIKIRRENLNENAPDELLVWNGVFRTVLKDKDADPASPVLSFRHLYAFDQGAVALVIQDTRGECLVIIKDGQMKEVARAGVQLKSFDYFQPKMKNGILVFRGVDLQNRKALWVHEAGVTKKLVTQGDAVITEHGPVRVNYQSQDALFYGAPGIGPGGEIYQQATLTTDDGKMTLVGIGLLKFPRE